MDAATSPHSKQDEKISYCGDGDDGDGDGLEDIFHQVVQLIRESSSSSSSASSANNDVKLKLYGLYKYITEGQCNIPPPSGVGIFNVVARSKYQAWKDVCSTDQEDNYCTPTRDEAMMEYIQILASTRNDDDDEIGEKCKLLLSGLLLNNNNNNNSNNQRQQQQESSSSSSDNIMTSSEDNDNHNNNLTTTTTLKEEGSAKLISKKEEGKKPRTFEIHHPNIIINNNNTTTCNDKNDNSNFMMWTTIILQKKWSEILLGYIGIRPLIPRGLLDISFKDLFLALIECCCTCTNTTITQQRHVLTEIIKIWKDATAITTTTTPANSNNEEEENNNNNNNVEEGVFEIAVGLSVRSIFDVYLSSKTYSMDSEMIVFPPINVPGMMYVAKYHNLNIVPVDIGGKNNEWWNWEGILEAITDRTVAIMIVHPFGIVSTSTKHMEQIRKLADKHKLELWEDCSECFMGLGGGNNNKNNCYIGNSLADIRFFSFGPIKTATALGGGIAIFKDQRVGRHIQNLCIELPQRQTNFQFFRRVLLSICLNFIGMSPIRVGILQNFCSILGISYDTVVTKAIRSFKIHHHVFDQQKATKMNNERDLRIQANFMKQIRKQPSLPLLKLLLRRTRQSTLVAPSLPARLSRCQEMKSLLESAIPDVLFSNPPNFNNTYWVFPISCADRDNVSRKLEQRGYDVVSGASQLCCISKFSNNDSKNKCPRTEELMDSILYLPIASQELLDMVDFVDCLQDAVSTGKREIDFPASSSNTLPATSTVVAITFSLFLLQFPFQMTLSPGVLFKLLSSILFLLTSAIVGSIVVLDLLRRLIANFYLDETTAFSQHCDMVDAATSEGVRNFDTSMEHVEKILPEIALLTLPAPSLGDKSTQRKVILTGATGFVGSLLLRDLLFHRDRLSLSGGVIVICRPKSTKSAQTRIADLLEQPMFSFLTKLDKKSLVRVMEGDVTKPLGGLSEADLNMVINDDSITHVFHTAAAVGFTQSLSDAARSNITSSLNMQALSMRLPNKNSTYVHISTAFVHGGRSGSKDAPLKETLFPLEPFSPREIYKSMLTTQYYASKAMTELRFPNTYTFSKCVCEHLLLSNKSAATMVIRPNIVGPAIETPFEGWAGKKPSTIVAGAALHLSSQWNIWYLERLPVSCIPVDVLSRFILAKAFDLSFCKTTISNETVTSSDGSFEKISRSSDSSGSASDAEQLETSIAIDGTISLNSQVIFNATWDPSSTAANSFCWLEFSIAYLQLGSVLGYFGRATSYLVLLVSARLMPFLRLGISSYERLHYFVVRLPIEVAMTCLDRCGVSSSGIAKIVPFLDLPLLFFPFMKKTFYFQSDLVAPKSFNSKRYAFSCGVAAHRFIAAMSRKRASKNGRVCAQAQISSLIVAGEYHQTCGPDLIWALSQPRGNYLLRLAAFVVIKILRIVCSAVTVDVASFRNASKIMKNPNNQVHLVLAPTHRSFFDFVLLSFIIFSLPELQIEIPVIVAANDFQRLPLIGWLARLLGAFYVRRGIGFEDCELTTRIQKIKEVSQTKNHACFEVFLEGKRSRDRRFAEPKTGFLKSLKQSGGDHAVIPIAINYESIPEHKELVWETTGNDSTGLSTIGFLSWLKAVVLGRVFIGKIHVAAANPLQMKCESSNDFKAFGKHVQRLQREMVLVSDYHVSAAARFFDIGHMSMKGALNDLGCRFWPTAVEPSRLSQTLPVPTDMSTLFSILMQCGPQLAPLFFSNRRQWSHWLDHAVQSGIELSEKCEAIRRIYEVLLDNFDYADSVVIEATNNLKEQGFSHPKQGHILQVALMLNKRTLPQMIRAAVTFQFPERKRNHPYHSAAVALDDLNLCDSSEKLGYWGFNDSGFAATSDNGGQRTVFMQGNRYSLSGKTMPGLIPFIESEMKVKIDMMREFQTCQSVRDDFRPSFLDDSCKVLLSENFKRVSFSTIERMRHGTGHSQEDIFGIREGCAFRIPDAVVWPASEQQVQKLVHMAKEKKWCLIPYGGGTNVTCATRCPEETVETRPIISVDMKLMCRIIWVNGEDGVAKIEAGITGRQLVQELDLRGYTMGHEPDSIEFSTLGGWIATKASGMKRNKYGNIEDIVKDVSVVSNDLIWEGRRREDETVVSGRRSEGMELLSLMLGSEGCLGIITSAVVRVWPLPEVREFDSILFPTFKDGLSFTRAVARLGGNAPSSVRLLDNAHFRLGQALRPGGSSITGQLMKLIYQLFLARSNKFDADSVACATITYEGSRSEVDGQKCTIKQIARNHEGTHLGEGVGKSGYDLTFMIAYLRDFALTYHILGESFETFVPWSKIDALIEATKRRISEEHQSRLLPGIPFVGCRVTQLYHEGACLYFYLCISIDGVENGSEIFTELETAAREEILKHGGSLSHHHGIGKIRAPFQRGKTNLCEVVKKGIDEDNIFGAQNGLYAGISFSK